MIHCPVKQFDTLLCNVTLHNIWMTFFCNKTVSLKGFFFFFFFLVSSFLVLFNSGQTRIYFSIDKNEKYVNSQVHMKTIIAQGYICMLYRQIVKPLENIINVKIFLWPSSKAMTDKERRGRQIYKNLNILRTKRDF